LDELIHAIDAAQDQMVDIEHLSDEELDVIAKGYERMRENITRTRGKRKSQAVEKQKA
jgi:low affinity Fe/Cu permease